VFELAGRSTVDALLDGYSGCIIAYGQARALRLAQPHPQAQQQPPRAAAVTRRALRRAVRRPAALAL
jgi:hypothetical protein